MCTIVTDPNCYISWMPTVNFVNMSLIFTSLKLFKEKAEVTLNEKFQFMWVKEVEHLHISTARVF